MEKRSDKEKKINAFSQADKDSLEVAITKLSTLKEKDSYITEESLRTLESVIGEVLAMKDRHSKYLIRWLKQGYTDY
jgi:hypothetical protein